MLYKVVYFDEGSATDFLQIQYGGNMEIVEKENGNISYNMKGAVTGEVTAGSRFLTVLKAGFSLKGEASLDKSNDTLLKKSISNTLLSDFVDFTSESKNKGKVRVFEGYSVNSIKDSIAYIKMYSPFIKLLKEDTELTKELSDINFIDTDEILKGAKGYYELLATNGDSEVILRFNIDAFRNGYTLSDLTKMELVYYGIKVGHCHINDLLFENEFPRGEESNRPTSEEIFEEQEQEQQPLLEIFDVLLAGTSGEVEE